MVNVEPLIGWEGNFRFRANQQRSSTLSKSPLTTTCNFKHMVSVPILTFTCQLELDCIYSSIIG